MPVERRQKRPAWRRSCWRFGNQSQLSCCCVASLETCCGSTYKRVRKTKMKHNRRSRTPVCDTRPPNVSVCERVAAFLFFFQRFLLSLTPSDFTYNDHAALNTDGAAFLSFSCLVARTRKTSSHPRSIIIKEILILRPK